MVTENKPKVIYQHDYKKPAYRIPEIQIQVDLHDDHARVKTRLEIVREPGALPEDPLVLNGEHLKLVSLRLNGKKLPEGHFAVTPVHLTVPEVPDAFFLEIENDIFPHENKALEGLYISGNIFCTQNEPEGFRKITYFIDRPDIMARYTTTITADKERFPILLSNGNPVNWGDLDHGRHYVTWRDPFPKPSYLFALVAGDLGAVEDQYVTRSGREITLKIYVDKGNEYKCDYAMESLKQAMKWDEDVFGLECDLDIYMIVAVDAFNFGAMENKGLNIFNSQYVLADPKTATDQNFEAIQSVIGHEYFHNWTGNRVTCRDWFQITLKEGLTVFREQEFSADMTSRAVKRIAEVRLLKDVQFPEDAGPNAHPIRPASYIQVNNFYTATVYNKGAEVIRMIETLIGKENFRRGIARYFDLFDGQAVTTEDFVNAMEHVSSHDLTAFKRWYSQAGTPVCRVSGRYDAQAKTYELDVEQLPPKTLISQKTEPFYFPLSVGLLDANGRDIPLKLKDRPGEPSGSTRKLVISGPRHQFVFTDVESRPVPSLLREFSAPVKLEFDYTEQDLRFLLSHDSDSFSRYEAGQMLANRALGRLIARIQGGRQPEGESEIVEAFGRLLADQSADPAFCAEALILPSLASLTESMDICDFDAAFKAREFLARSLAEAHQDVFREIYDMFHATGDYSVDPAAVGRRSLKNTALHYLMRLETREVFELAVKQFQEATNMTDELAALDALCQSPFTGRENVIQAFYKKWNQEPLVMNKWFAVQAGSRQSGALERVKRLENDPAFDKNNPNKIRALYGVFSQNLVQFHAPSGEGYALIAERIQAIDRYNPSAAAKLALAFRKLRCLEPGRKEKAVHQLEKILAVKDLSPDVYEIVSKTLASVSCAEKGA